MLSRQSSFGSVTCDGGWEGQAISDLGLRFSHDHIESRMATYL